MLKQEYNGIFECGSCKRELSEKERYFFDGKEGMCKKCAGAPEEGWFKEQEN